MIDNIKITRSVRRRTVSVQITPDAGIAVTAPYFFPDAKIQKFINENREWIEQKQREILLRNQNRGKNTEEFWYLGQKYPLEKRQNKNNIVEFENTFYVASSNGRSIKAYLTSWYRQQARKIIQERVNHFSNISGFRYHTMSITETETRWGSSSSHNNL